MGNIRININNREIVADSDKNILQIALENGIEIPHLCYDERIEPYGACGLCVVEIEGSPKLARACATKPANGMIIKTDTQRIRETRKSALNLLCSDHRGDCRPPCMLACPGKTDCQGYVGLIANGEYKEALKLAKDKIPLPASIGRVCPHPCETACRRQLVEEPIAIASLKSFIADLDLEDNTYIPEVKASTGKKVAVVGGGPAGLSCAYFLAREGHSVEVYEAMPHPGGMLRYGIPEYRLPKEVLDKEISIIEKMGVKINCNMKIGRDITMEYLKKSYDSVFLGIGAWKSSNLGCDGEDLDGVFGGIDFLIKVASNENVSIGKKVIVVGGGNTAMDVSRTAVRLGAEEVTVLYRRTREEMPAEKIEIEEAEEEGVKFSFLLAPIEVVNKDGKASGIRCQKMMLGEPDATGRRKPVPIPGEEVVFEADMIISAIGQRIDASGIDGIETVKNGALKIDERTYMTNAEGVFAGGDAVTGPNIAIAAIGHGRTCAELIHSYLNGVTKYAEEPMYVKQNDLTEKDFTSREKLSRVKNDVTSPEVRRHNFVEIGRTLTEEEARKESSRCLECGCGDYFECQLYKYINDYGVNPDDFKGTRPKHEIINEHPFITRNQDKCVLCGLCIRACDEVMGVTALGLVNRGFDSVVMPEFGMKLESSSCISCGQCTDVCPTGACMEKLNTEKNVPVNYESVDGICSFCSVGCNLKYDTKSYKVMRAVPAGTEEGILCQKGKFKLSHLGNSSRKYDNIITEYGNKSFTDSEAMLYLVKKLQAVNASYGKGSVGFAVSSGLSNEELYAVKKLSEKLNTEVTGSFTEFDRAALKSIIGFDGSTNSFEEIGNADVVLGFGAIAENHPVLGVKIKNAASGKTVFAAVNDKKTRADEWAKLSVKPDNSTAFIKSFIKELAASGHADLDKLKVSNLEEIKKAVNSAAENEDAKKLAKLYGEAKKAMIIADEESLSKEAVELLGTAAAVTGNVGKAHRGIIVAGRKSNSQGLKDMGIKMSGKELLHKIEDGSLKALVVIGEDPSEEYAEVLKKLDFLAVFDLFETKTVKAADMFSAASAQEEGVGSYTRADRKVQFRSKGIKSKISSTTLDKLLMLIDMVDGTKLTVDSLRKLISQEINGYEPMDVYAAKGEGFHTYLKSSLSSDELIADGETAIEVKDEPMFETKKVFDTVEKF